MVSEQEAKLSPMELDEAKARELEEKFDSEIRSSACWSGPAVMTAFS